MWRSVLAHSAAVFVFTQVVLGDVSACENPVEDGAESGECLLQSQLGNARQTGKYSVSDHLSEDEREEDEEDPEEEPEEEPVEDEEDDEDEGPDEQEASELQYNTSAGVCGNWYGNNLDWNSVKATGKADGNGSPWGTVTPDPEFKTSICNWDTTGGLQGVVGNQHSPGPKTLAYSCKGTIKGKDNQPCKSTVRLGKNGGGLKVDCLNGLCADPTNIKGDWSQSKPGYTCTKSFGRAPNHKKVAPTYNLLSANGNPMLSLWDPNCKVLCESIPECTGFTVKTKLTKKYPTPYCTMFSGATYDSPTTGMWVCRTHAHFSTYFLKRK